MKKAVFIAAVLFSSIASMAQDGTHGPRELKSFEVKQTYTAGNARVESYELPAGSVLYIHSNNGTTDLVADIPKGSGFPEPLHRKVLEKNVTQFTEL